MKIAVFSDIHSNRHALQTVLETIEKESVDVVACAGDLVGYGPHPNEVIDEIKRRGFPTIMGNYDEGVGFDRDDCGCAYSTPVEVETGRASLQWTKAEVTADNKAFLRSLPSQVLWEREDERILMVHGSPRRINEYLYEDRRTDTIERMLKPLDIDALIMGHTHLPYHRIVDGVHLINDGSVGRPKDGDTRACYAVIDTGDDYRVEFRRVPYPVEEVAEAMNERGLPRWLSEYLRYAGKMP
ncbi:MAG TPA: metallophosphoesterase family protein [Patescibacteria group bacterium]|nr:metallophosphoesterase family protein [Patescibacteria group bacterium]